MGTLDQQGIETAFGITGRMQDGGVLMLDFPREDISAMVHGLKVAPDLALDSEALFKQMGSTTMMMGELALLEREVAPVLTGLLREGISVSAIHNHLITSPVALFVHFMGQGDGVRLARSLRRALTGAGVPIGPQKPNTPANQLPFNTKLIEQIFGQTGETAGSVFVVSISRKEQITMNGMPVPSSFGADTHVYFQPLGGRQAAVQSEMVLLASEVEAVMQTLRQRNFDVQALHNHNLSDKPRLFYMHSWARGNAVSIARVVHAALGHTNSA